MSSTEELERGTLDVPDEQHEDEHEYREAHLYDHSTPGYAERPKVTMCGLPAHLDEHGSLHPGCFGEWRKGSTSCSICGVPLCMDCLLIASALYPV